MSLTKKTGYIISFDLKFSRFKSVITSAFLIHYINEQCYFFNEEGSVITFMNTVWNAHSVSKTNIIVPTSKTIEKHSKFLWICNWESNIKIQL